MVEGRARNLMPAEAAVARPGGPLSPESVRTNDPVFHRADLRPLKAGKESLHRPKACVRSSGFSRRRARAAANNKA